ncbi:MULTISPECIES: diguanylate cyclase domain-containing protein [Giesbergeria]|uniref:Diguanylate cyclase domain-containing protein n=1 Tax=Giesbergeria sinuosa TaxID=80883 RepID=A0ABV9QDC0_9BURK
MTSLHIPTMFVMLFVGVMAMALSIASVAYRRQPDLQVFSWGLLAQSVGYALFFWRDQVSPLLSVVLGNMAINAAMALYVLALYRFQGRKAPRGLVAIPVVIVGLGTWWLVDAYQARRILLSFITLLQFVHMSVLLWQGRQQIVGRGKYILGFAAVLTSLTMLYRIVVTLAGLDSAQKITDSTLTVILSFMLSLLDTLLLSVGMLVMAQERSEQARVESEHRYRKLIESANEGICVLENGVLRFVNPKFIDLFGYSRDELLGQSILSFIHPDDRPLVYQNHQKRLQGHADDLKYPARVLTKNRGVRWMEISGVAIDWCDQPSTLNFCSDITERQQMDERIRALAFHDALTHLPNRRLLHEQLDLAMTNNQGTGQHSAVVFMDLDNFKPLNDRYGHHIGDLLLIEVAQRLRQTIRGSDTAARLGGDEFVVVLNGLSNHWPTATEQARHVAEKVIQALSEPYQLQDTDAQGQPTVIEHRCTASAGVTFFSGHDTSAEQLLDQADAAMYRAKDAGRNRMEFFQPPPAVIP